MIVALNKVDNLKPGHIITQMKAAGALGDFHALHPVSAKTKDGIDELRGDLVHLLPEGQPYFPREAATDQTSEERIAELIREKALQLTRDEVPHSISVELDELDEKLLRAFVLVETESQKQILVGKKGAMIREIGTRARPEIEALLGHKVFLELVVKVRPKWRRDDADARAARALSLLVDLEALVSELERLDRDLVAEPVERPVREPDRPRVPQQPALDGVLLLVVQRDHDVAPQAAAVAHRVPPVVEAGVAHDSPLEDDVRVVDEAGELARAQGLVGALAVLDDVDSAFGQHDLAEAGDLVASELDAEVEVQVGVVTLDRHGEPPSR